MLARLEDDRLPNVRYMVVDAEDMPFGNAVDISSWHIFLRALVADEGLRHARTRE